MKTIVDVKQDLIDYLLSIDKTNLSMMELKLYCEVVSTVDAMFKPNPADYLPSLVSGLNTLCQPKTTKLKEE